MMEINNNEQTETTKDVRPHILMASAECYPAAKVGGLADVVGSLPRYLNKSAARCAVIIPKYHNSWIAQQEVNEVHYGNFQMGHEFIEFWVQYVVNDELGYVDITSTNQR